MTFASPRLETGGTAAPVARPPSARDRRRTRGTGLLLTAPALIALGVTIVYPLIWTIWLSFRNFGVNASAPQQFVGLANYQRVLSSPGFMSALLQTIGYVVVTLTLELVLGLAIAQLLRFSTRTNRALRMVVALPLMIAPVVASMAFRFLFSNDYGLINHWLGLLQLPAHSWFSSPWLARGTILVANLWLALPFVVLVLLAGMAGIPDELDEAARTDGANGWQIFLRVTLPLLRPSILIILLIRLADAFRVFDAVYVLTGAGPANSTDVMSTFLYRTMFQNSDFPGGAAVTVLFVVVVAAFAGGLFLALRGRGQR